MPRHTLDKWTYKLKTMDVCITQHKEDDVYNHMVKVYQKIQELFEKYKSMYDKIIKVDLDSDSNMYKTYNWRQGEPSRFWLKNVEQWYMVDVSDDNREVAQAEYFQLYQIWSDFMICDNHGDDWLCEKEDWNEMVQEVNNIHHFIKNSYDTIRLYENMAYHEAKQEWMRLDKDWIDEQNRKKEHKKHSIIERPSTTNIDKIPDPYPEAPLRDDCIYCRQHWEEMKPKYEMAVKLWTKNKQEYEEWEEQQKIENIKVRQEREKKIKQHEQWLAKQDPINLHCDHCDFEAEDDIELEEHNETDEHKEKLRFCKCCNVQCPSEYAFKNHLETTKHKKNAGLIDNGPKVYKCKDCDYQTITKANFERHCFSKHKKSE